MLASALALNATPDRRRWISLGLAAIVISSFGVMLRSASITALPGTTAWSIEGVVTGDLQKRTSHVIGHNFVTGTGSLMVRIERISSEGQRTSVRAPARLLVEKGFPELTPGTRIALAVSVLPRVDSSLVLRAQDEPRILNEAGVVQRAAQRVRHGLRDAARHLPRHSAGLLPGLVDGDTNLLDPKLNRDMRDTNLTHLTAVSGANLALVTGFVLFFARLAGASRRALPFVAVLSITSFVIIARTDPSVMRAAVMSAVLILASAVELPAVGLTSLLAAICLLVLVDPGQAKRPGFVLSVLATAGILIFAQGWSALLARRMPRWLALSLSVPLAAQILCTPYLVVISQQLSLVGIWTNLLVAPAVAPATILGFLAGITSLISPTLAIFFAWLAALPLSWIAFVAEWGARLPFANVRWIPGWAGSLCAAALLIGIYCGIRRRPRLTLIIYALFLVALTLLRTTTPWWPGENWAMAMCDVGQGDGLVLRTDDHSAVVVDAGPEPDLIDACLGDLGITEIPAVILSHNHADHVEGLPGVLRHRKVEAIWVSPEVEPEFESKRVKRWASDIPVSTIRIGAAYQWERLQLLAVWPREEITSGSIPNNSSIVLIAQWSGHRALLLGDVEAEAQIELAHSITTSFEIVKVAHHGSANQDQEWLSRLRPQVALISVGAVNPYGHPNSATLALIARTRAHIYRTDRDGSVALSFDTRGIVVKARGHPWWRPR